MIKRAIFLGTPAVAAQTLKFIHEHQEEAQIELIAVVCQPPARNERGGQSRFAPVHAYAHEKNIPVFTPESARDKAFLNALTELKPDICITAAYGNFLPQEFLAIPRYGTVNIHPSLLPKYRGAAPVQRTLEDGCSVTGVTLCFTVLAMDAGPIIDQTLTEISSDENATDLLARLFLQGSERLVKILPQLFSGTLTTKEQDPTLATHAKKITIEESLVNFTVSAQKIHNKVRAFTPWPGVKTKLLLNDTPQEIKIIKTRVNETLPSSLLKEKKIFFANNALNVVCAENSLLEILELQQPGKRVMGAKDFWNGLKEKKIDLL